VEVGIRELRDALSRYMAEVRKGHTLIVTDHGRAIARITPMEQPTAYDRLVAEGVIQPPRSRTRSLPEPIKAKGTVSDLVADQRR
jgi:prevent-host-death family protein